MKQIYAICRGTSLNFGKIAEGEDPVETRQRLRALTRGSIQFHYVDNFQPTLEVLDENPQLRAICRTVWGTVEGGQFEFVDENLRRLKVVEVPTGTGL